MDSLLQAFINARAARKPDNHDRIGKEHASDYATAARAYVNANRAEMERKYADRDIDNLVRLVDRARERGDDEAIAEIDAWLIAEHPVQHIGGTVNRG
jgi:uncharacterized membrane-anchored protein